MTDHLAAARAAIHAEHGWSMAAPASSLADMAYAIARILDHLEAAQTPDVDWKAVAGSADAVIRATLAEMGHGPEVDPVLAVRELMQAQTDASIRRGLDDAAAGRTEHLEAQQAEPEPDPLDESNHTDRIDRRGVLWIWCNECDGLRIDGHEGHRSGYGWSAFWIDKVRGPLTLAPRPEDGDEPEPGPRCDANKADRIDRYGARWVWCDGCDGLRMGVNHGMHKSGYGWSASWLDEVYGPLTFAPPMPECNDCWLRHPPGECDRG